MTRLAVKRPILTTVIFIIILILGYISYRGLPIDFFPNIDLPVVTVMTVYPGASPVDIEEQVTKPIENAIATVPNIDKIESKSLENISLVTASFEWGSDLNVAASDIRDKVGLAEAHLPDDAQKPLILKFDASMMPVMVLNIKGDLPVNKMYDIVDRYVVDRLKEVPGVGAATIMGGKQNKVNIDIIPSKIVQYNLSLSQIKQMIMGNNLTMPAGNIDIGKKKYSIRVPGEYENIEQIKHTVVGYTKMGNPIMLKDIADVTFSPGKEREVNLVGGKEGITLIIQKQSGANTVKVAEGVRKELKSLKPILPKGTEITTVMDGSRFIKASIKNLFSTILWGFVFVVIVVFLFLWNLRGSFVIALTIPFSLITAFIYLYFSHNTINIISLSSLSIALGMVVDNSIVVLENIFRHRDEEKQTRRESSIFGATEVGGAITASTLTTIAIFIPIFFIKGFTSVLFKQLAMTISIVLAGSLFTSLTLTPMLSSIILRRRRNVDEAKVFSLRMFRKLENSYQSFLAWALKHKATVLVTLTVVFVLTLGLLKFVGSEFIPQSDESMIRATIKLPIGTNLKETKKIGNKVIKIIERDIPEARAYRIMMGQSESNFTAVLGGEQGDNIISLTIKLKPKLQRKRSDVEIADVFRKEIKKIPDVYSLSVSTGGMESSLMGEKPISVEIYGYDIDATQKYAELIKREMTKIKGLKDLSLSREEGRPELWVKIDRDKALAKGISVYGLSDVLYSSMEGSKISVYRKGGKEYDIVMEFKDGTIKNESDLRKIPVRTAMGTMIPLGAIATIEKRVGPVSIEHKDQIRVIKVGAGYSGHNLGGVNKQIQKILKDHPRPPEVDYVDIGGTVKNQQDSFRDMLFAVLIGILLVYLVMAAQFESFIDPFVIMFSIPFALTGVIWALFITGNSFSLMSYVGLLMLVGIVVNNAIVLLDYTNVLRARGQKLYEAILNAGKRRLRPVLMTATTTIFGLLPLALSRGEGSETWVPLGVSVIGGLLVSTIVTLVVVPVIYSIFESHIKRSKEV